MAPRLVRRIRPVHVSIIGGEPRVRYREMWELLPSLDRMGIEVELVTSAVRPIPRRVECHRIVAPGCAPAQVRRWKSPSRSSADSGAYPTGSKLISGAHIVGLE